MNVSPALKIVPLQAEHVATMVGCQDPNVAKVAPRVERAVLAAALLGVFAWFALAAS